MKIIYKASFIHSLIEVIAFFLFFFGKSRSLNVFKENSKNQSKTVNGQQTLKDNNTRSVKLSNCYEKKELSKSISIFGFDYSKTLTNFIW